MTTRYEVMRRHWERNSVLAERGILGTNKPIGRDVDLGGAIIRLDWDSARILKKFDISCPSGIALWNDGYAAASMRRNEIYLFRNDKIIKTISHPCMNDIHSISVTKANTLLVASTGLDGILEFNTEGECIWSWFAFQHGYNTDQYGRTRVIDVSGTIDHRGKDYPTLYQTTHMNSVIENPENPRYLILTFFHQGTVVLLDKNSGITKVILNGLGYPHAIRNVGSGFIVSDTTNGEIVFLNRLLEREYSIDVKSRWLQDAILVHGENYFAIRGDHGDIIEIDSKSRSILRSFTHIPSWKAFSLEYLGH